METEKKLELLNKKVKQLFDLYPIDFEDPTEPTHEMKFALAKFYGEEGTRRFLENMVKNAEHKLRDCVTVYEIAVIKERINVLLQILTTSKAMFSQAQKLEKGLNEST